MAEPRATIESDTLALDDIDAFTGDEVARLVVEVSPGVHVSKRSAIAGILAYINGALANLGFGQLASAAIDNDATGASASASKFWTSLAAKTYVDQILAAQDAMVFKGAVDCAANPNYPAADRGHTYRVSVAGKIGGASGVNVEAGDLVMCVTDSTAAGNQATVGANWVVSQTNIDGGVIGPASATDGSLARYDGASGKLLKNGVSPDGSTIEISGSDLRVKDQGVSLPKLANLANHRLIGRDTSGSGTPEALTLSQLLDWVGSAADGDMLLRSGGAWARLAKGTDAQVLKIVSGAPAWATQTGTYTAKTGFVKAHRTTSQTSMTAGADNKVQLNVEEADAHNRFDNATNYDYTADRSGWYDVKASVSAACSVTDTPMARIYKNGSPELDGTYAAHASNTLGMTSFISKVDGSIYLAIGDKITLYVYLPTGVTSIGGSKRYCYLHISPKEQDV